MSGSEQFDFPDLEESPPSVQWRSWPVRERMAAASMVVGGLVAAGLLVRWITGQTHLALVAVAVLAIALARFFLPTLFELNPDGVSQWRLGRRRRIPWREIRSYEICAAGVLLLPHADPCPLDAYRGLYLPWGQHRDEVLAHLHYYLDRRSGV